MIVAQDFSKADINIIDTKTVAGYLANLIHLENQLVQSGLDAADKLPQINQKRKHERMYFMFETFEYLHKVKRIGMEKALVGGIPQVKSFLTLRNAIYSPPKINRLKRKQSDGLLN